MSINVAMATLMLATTFVTVGTSTFNALGVAATECTFMMTWNVILAEICSQWAECCVNGNWSDLCRSP